VDGRQGGAGAGLPEPGGAEAEAGKQSWELGWTGRHARGAVHQRRAEVRKLRNPPGLEPGGPVHSARTRCALPWGRGRRTSGQLIRRRPPAPAVRGCDCDCDSGGGMHRAACSCSAAGNIMRAPCSDSVLGGFFLAV